MMDFKIKKDADKGYQEKQQNVPEEKKNQTPQLLLLLLLLAGFGYVYFFTGLIKPLPETKTIAPPPPPHIVKKALPQRDATSPDAPSAVSAPESKTAPQTPQAATHPAPPVPSAETAKNNGAPPARNLPDTSVKAAVPAKTQPVAKPVAVVPDVKKNVASKETRQKASEKHETPATLAKHTNSSPRKQVVATAKPVAKPEKPALKPSADAKNWILIAGNYLLESEMAADMARIRKAGLEPSITAEKRIKAKMNRLFIGEYNDRAVAQSVLDKLKRQTSDAFMLEHGGTFSVYAGSYLLEDRVAEERDRLAAAGVVPTIRKVEVALPAKGLSAGIFGDKKSAEAARRKLIAAGITKAALVPCK